MRSKDRKILIGKIGKPHGIKGFVYFHYYGKEVSNLQLYDKLHLEDISTFKLDKIQQKSDRLIIKLVGCDDRNSVENLRNKDVYIDEDDGSAREWRPISFTREHCLISSDLAINIYQMST